MKTTIRKSLSICLICIICILSIGCQGQESGITQNGQNDEKKAVILDGAEKNYSSENLFMPGFDEVRREYMHNSTLYFPSLFTRDESAGMERGIYALDVTAPAAFPVKLPIEIGDGEEVQYLALDETGELYLLVQSYPLDMESDMPEGKAKQELFIRKYKADGMLQFSHDITSYFDELEYKYCVGLEVDSNGHMCIALPNNELIVLDSEGGLIYQTSINGGVNQLLRSSNDIYLSYMGAQGAELRRINIEEKELSGKILLPFESNVEISAGMMEEFLVDSGDSVYSYNIERNQLTPLLQWSDLNIMTNRQSPAFFMQDGRIIRLVNDTSSEPSGIKVFIANEESGSNELQSEKTIVTIGVLSQFLSRQIEEEILNFNYNQDDIKVEIIRYGTTDAWPGILYTNADIADTDSMFQLNMDILLGRGPDILILPPKMSMALYAQNGILEDIYTYIDQDAELEREDFVTNILEAFETDGKLYGIPINFMILTMYGKHSDLGDNAGWTIDDMIAFADENPDNQDLFLRSSKTDVMDLCTFANQEVLVDINKDSNNFNKELYIKIIEFANRFQNPESYELNTDVLTRAMEDELLLVNARVSDSSTLQLAEALFRESITYIGYPSENGSGHLATSTNVLAINSGSKVKEQAWEFIRQLLSSDFHTTGSWRSDFSIRKDGLESMFEKDMEVWSSTLADGTEIISIKGFTDFQFTVNDDPFQINVYAGTEEQISTIREMIHSVDSIRSYDASIHNIMTEEAQYYFSGIKSAAEVADIAASRIALYVAESK